LQAIGDALEPREATDDLCSAHDVADLALSHAAGNGDLRLTRASVLTHQREQSPDVAGLQRRNHLWPFPERAGDHD